MEFKDWLNIKTNLSEITIGQYVYWAKKILEDIGNIWDGEAMTKYLVDVKLRYKPNSTKVIFSSVKMYLTYIGEGIDMPRNPKLGDIKTKAITESELNNICDNYVYSNFENNKKYRSIMRVLFYTGLRASELLNLEK